MAIQISDNIRSNSNKPLDYKFGPFLSIAQANFIIPIEQRYNGLIFGVYATPGDIPNSKVDYYKYKNSLTDTDIEPVIDKDAVDGVSANNTATLNINTVDDIATTPRIGRTALNIKDLDRGGQFTYVASGLTANGGTIFDANEGGYWVRNFSGSINAKWFGANGNGITDNSLVFNSLFDYAHNNGIGKIFVPEGDYLFLSPVTYKKKIHLFGEGIGKTFFTSGATNKILTWVSTTDFIEISYITFKGSGEAISHDGFDYLSTAHIHHCEFYASLFECIKGNLILCDINNNLFGYSGNPHITQHRHINSKGNYLGNSTNINRITNNRFYRAVGAESVRFEAGYQVSFIGNNFEANTATTTVRILGMYQLDLERNWFENNSGVYQVYLSTDTSTTLGNRVVTVIKNWFFLGNVTNEFIFYLGGATSNFDFINNAGTGFAGGKGISKNISNVVNGSISTYYNNYLTGFDDSVINKFDLIKPIVSTKGFSRSAWLEDWSTTNLQGWTKASISGWSQSTTSGYLGNSINYTTSASGNNFFYITLPVEYFKGKTIQLRGIANRLTGTASALALGYNTTQATPTSLTAAGTGTFGSTTITDLSRLVEIPSDATYLHVGFRSGGWAGTGQIIAFDVWIIEGEFEPTFSRGIEGISATVAAGQVLTASGPNLAVGQNELFWDSTNKRLGINTPTPQAPIHIVASASADNSLIQKIGYTPATLDTYNLQLKTRTSAGNVRYAYAMINNSILYDDFLVFMQGKIGILTIDPTESLDINGKIRIRERDNGGVTIATWSSTGVAQQRTPAQAADDILNSISGYNPSVNQRLEHISGVKTWVNI